MLTIRAKRPKNLAVLLQQEFEEIWKWIYYCISPMVAKIGGVPFPFELLWVVNGHAKNLEAIENGYAHATKVQEEILYYTLKLWNSFSSQFPLADEKIKNHLVRYEETYSNFLSTILPEIQDDTTSISPIGSKYIGSFGQFFSMQESLIKQCQNFLVYLQSLSFSFELLSARIEIFQKKLQDSQRQLKNPYHKQITTPQEYLSLCIQGVAEILQMSGRFLSFAEDDRMIGHLTRLIECLQESQMVPPISSPKQIYTIVYIPIFHPSFSSPILWLQSTTKGFVPAQWEYTSVVSWQESELQLIRYALRRYKETPNQSVYRNFLAHFEQVSSEDTFSSLCKKIEPDRSFVQWFFEWANDPKCSQILPHILSLAEACHIQIITPSSVQNYCNEPDMVKEEFSLGEKKEDRLIQVGWVYQEKVLQQAILHHVVHYCGKFLSELEILEQWLISTFPKHSFLPKIIPLIHNLRSPKFWYTCQVSLTPREGLVYPRIVEILGISDAVIYSHFEHSNRKIVRKEYEDILRKISFALQADSFHLAILAGQLPDIHAIAGLPVWEKKWFLYLHENSRLLPKEMTQEIEPYYPCLQENFCRYIISEQSIHPGNMVYVRGIEPEIYLRLTFWKDKVSKQCSDTIQVWVQNLQKYWPENKDSLTRELEQCLQMLSNTISLNEWIKIQQVLSESPDFPTIVPSPEIIGKMYPSIEVPESLLQANIQYVFHEKEYRTICRIDQYAFDWKRVKITVSNGSCDLALQLAWSLLQAANALLRQFPFLSERNIAENSETIENFPQPPCEDILLQQIWPAFLSNLQPISPQEFYQNFIRNNNQDEIHKLENMIALLQWADRLSMIFYPDAQKIQSIANSIADFLQQRGITIEPLDMQNIPVNAQVIPFLSDKEEFLAIRQRRILHYTKQTILLHGYHPSYSNPSLPFQLQWTSQSHVLVPLRKVFLEYWCYLHIIANRLLREKNILHLEMAYYRLHAQPTLPYLIDFLNLGYEYWENVQTFIPWFTFQALWLPIQEYLASHNFHIISIQPFEIYHTDLHALYYEKEESLLSHPYPIGTILRIKQPAILYTQEKRIWQKGKALVVVTTNVSNKHESTAP